MSIKKLSEKKTKKIELDLTGPAGNAYYLMAYAETVGKQIGMNVEERRKVIDEMRSGDYENLIKIFDKKFGKYVDLYR
jgi:hypothetical protein